MRHINLIMWEAGDRVLTPRGPAQVIQAPFHPWPPGMPSLVVRLDRDGSDWEFSGEDLKPEPGMEESSGPFRCQHVAPALSAPGEPVRCAPCMYCGLAFEEWESQR